MLHKRGGPLISKNIDILGYSTLRTPVQKKYNACGCVCEEFQQAKHAKVIDEINRSQYNFIYAKNSKIFHRYDCELLMLVLRRRKTSGILKSIELI